MLGAGEIAGTHPRVRREPYRNKIAAADKDKNPGRVPSGVPDARRLYERRVA
jgi:hypothetical protein